MDEREVNTHTPMTKNVEVSSVIYCPHAKANKTWNLPVLIDEHIFAYSVNEEELLNVIWLDTKYNRGISPCDQLCCNEAVYHSEPFAVYELFYVR